MHCQDIPKSLAHKALHVESGTGFVSRPNFLRCHWRQQMCILSRGFIMGKQGTMSVLRIHVILHMSCPSTLDPKAEEQPFIGASCT